MSFLSELKIAKHYYDKYRQGPVMVDIHPTLACQNRCYYCISAVEHITGIKHDNFSRAKKLEWAVLKRAIMDMIDMGVKSVQLTGGGEPTTYPEFQQLLKELAPLKVGLITNGILAGEYAKEIVEGCDWVRVSLDAVGGEMYQQIKGVDHYAEVIDSVHKLVAAKGQNKRGPRIGVAYILTLESIPGIKEVAMELKDSGINYLQFKDVVMRGLRFTSRHEEKIKKSIAELQDLPLKVFYTAHGTYDEDQTPKDIPQCNATDYVAVLGADGCVYGCCHLEYMPHASYGSIYEQPFRQIWENRPLVQVSEDLCWNCRYKRTNEVIQSLKLIQDEEFL